MQAPAGTVSGPVGTVLDINSFASQGGTMDCGGWTRVFGNPYGNTTVNCDLLACCVRETGAPDTITWTVYEMADLPLNRFGARVRSDPSLCRSRQ